MSVDPFFKIQYPKRVVSFPIESAGAGSDGKGHFHIEIESNIGNVDWDSLDGGYGPPLISANWKDGRYRKLEDLRGSVVEIPMSYDESIGDHVSVFYLSGHYDIKDLKLEFGEIKEGFMIVKFYGIVPDGQISIEPDHDFSFSGMVKIELP